MDPAERQPAADDGGDQFDSMTPGRLRVDGVADGLNRQREGTFGGEAAIDLPQIVEGDGWHRAGRQRPRRVVRAQPAQQAVADAAVGNEAKAVLDPGDGADDASVLTDRKPDRVQRGEPADGRGEIDMLDQFLSAMAFQSDPKLAGTGQEPPLRPAPSAGFPARWRAATGVPCAAAGR